MSCSKCKDGVILTEDGRPKVCECVRIEVLQEYMKGFPPTAKLSTEKVAAIPAIPIKTQFLGASDANLIGLKKSLIQLVYPRPFNTVYLSSIMDIAMGRREGETLYRIVRQSYVHIIAAYIAVPVKTDHVEVYLTSYAAQVLQEKKPLIIIGPSTPDAFARRFPRFTSEMHQLGVRVFDYGMAKTVLKQVQKDPKKSNSLGELPGIVNDGRAKEDPTHKDVY